MLRSQPAQNGRRRVRVEERIPLAPGYGLLVTASGMGNLLAASVRTALRRPFSWGPDTVEEMASAIRRCMVPLALAGAVFAFGLVITYVSGVVKTIGTLDRATGGSELGFTREAARWISMMVVAGVAGSAITADLGARKIRDELDALDVLGVNRIRSLAVPRILGMTLITPVLGLVTLMAAIAVTYFGTAVAYRDVLAPASALGSLWTFAYSTDILSYIVELTVCGLAIGVIATYKGLTAGGGTEGVGRAVNESILISYAVLWVFHTLFQFLVFSLFPDLLVLRG